MREERVPRDHIGPGPEIEMAEPEENRQEAERHPGDGARCGLEDAARHESPIATRQVMEHGDGERAERDSDPEDEGDEIGAIELHGIEDCPDEARRRADEPDHECRATRARELRRERVALGRADQIRGRADRDRRHRSSSARASGDTSARVAFWLRWSARM